jgi:hypothetical protein
LKKQLSANKKVAAPETLKGWQEIAAFLGEPISVVHRWAAEGMPVHREGRFVSTSADEPIDGLDKNLANRFMSRQITPTCRLS